MSKVNSFFQEEQLNKLADLIEAIEYEEFKLKGGEQYDNPTRYIDGSSTGY